MRRHACLALLGALLLLAACGGDEPVAQPVRWSESKVAPRVGRVRAAVTERPSADRARIEARWENRSASDTCALELIVPDGVVVLEGERRTPLGAEDAAGSATWLVEFPTGRALDAVLRFCAETEEGLRATETSVRLTDGP